MQITYLYEEYTDIVNSSRCVCLLVIMLSLHTVYSSQV